MSFTYCLSSLSSGFEYSVFMSTYVSFRICFRRFLKDWAVSFVSSKF